MTREELIKHLEHLADYVKYSEDAPALREVIEMLTNLQPTCNELATNCISRREAIDICAHAISLWHGQLGEGALIAVRDKIKELPSAQPEIIQCKDCMYGGQDEVGRWFCISLGCQIGNEDGSGYCADAERREG